MTITPKLLRCLRINANLTQSNLAALLKVDASLIAHLEADRRRITEGQITKLRELFDTDYIESCRQIVSAGYDERFMRPKPARANEEYIYNDKGGRLSLLFSRVLNLRDIR